MKLVLTSGGISNKSIENEKREGKTYGIIQYIY